MRVRAIGYVWGLRQAPNGATLSAPEKLAMYALAVRMDAKGRACMTLPMLAAHGNLRRAHMERVLLSLRANRLLQWESLTADGPFDRWYRFPAMAMETGTAVSA